MLYVLPTQTIQYARPSQGSYGLSQSKSCQGMKHADTSTSHSVCITLIIMRNIPLHLLQRYGTYLGNGFTKDRLHLGQSSLGPTGPTCILHTTMRRERGQLGKLKECRRVSACNPLGISKEQHMIFPNMGGAKRHLLIEH